MMNQWMFKDNVKLYTSAEMIERANLNWKVRQAPVLFEGNGLSKFANKLVNFRDDNGGALGIVSPSYKVIQNSSAFAFLDSLVGDTIESYIGAGSYKGGAVVWIRAKLPGDIQFANNPDDRGAKFVDFYTSHDGSIALETAIVALRLVCTNGLRMPRKITSGTVKHTVNANLSALRESLGLLSRNFDLMAQLSEKMSTSPVTRDRLPSILEKVGLVPAETGERSTRAKNIIDEVSRLFDGYGHGATLNGSRGTAWGAYNAITEYVDHRRGSDSDKRAESANIGSGARVKETALELLSA